jgi:hypothetical protein
MPSSPASPSPTQDSRPSDTHESLQGTANGNGSFEVSKLQNSAESTSDGVSDSGSPPVEVVNDLKEDEDMSSERSTSDVHLIGDETWIEDPTWQFPFQEAGDSLKTSIARVVQYLYKRTSLLEQVYPI